jgi:hypothetical protein
VFTMSMTQVRFGMGIMFSGSALPWAVINQRLNSPVDPTHEGYRKIEAEDPVKMQISKDGLIKPCFLSHTREAKKWQPPQ